MNLTPFAPLIFVVAVGIVLALIAGAKKISRTRLVSRETRDTELEAKALKALDQLTGLLPTDQRIQLRIMFAWKDTLPSYITEDTVEEGVEAVIRLIERTSFLREEKATALAVQNSEFTLAQ